MARFFAEGVMVEYPDELDQNTITFEWGELRPAMVKELAEMLWDHNPRDPRIAELNELYSMIAGE
jgi:hypothetical protein